LRGSWAKTYKYLLRLTIVAVAVGFRFIFISTVMKRTSQTE
jgi:hypothetical protein